MKNSKNGSDQIVGTLNFTFWLRTLCWKELKSIASDNHQQASYSSQLEFWTALLLPTAPVLSYLKGVLSQELFEGLSTGVPWGSDQDPLLHPFLGAFGGVFWGHCPAGRPMSKDASPAFRHWALRCDPRSLDNLQISWYLHTVKASSARGSRTNPETSLNLLPNLLLTLTQPESAGIRLELDWSCSSTIRTILRCNLASLFLFCPRPGRWAAVPWVWNFFFWNTKTSRDGLVTLRLVIFLHSSGSQVLRQLSSPAPVLHV